MIVKMKKLTLLCLASEKDQTLESVREFGQLHVDHIQKPEGHDLETLRLKLAHVGRVLETWPKGEAEATSEMTADQVLGRVAEIQHCKSSAENAIEDMQAQIKAIEPFGNFDPHVARRLDQFQGLYKTRAKQELPEIKDGFAHVCSEAGGLKYFAAISTKEQVVDADQIAMPDMSLAEIRQVVDRAERELTECDQRMHKLAAQRPVLEAEAVRLAGELHYREVSKGMGSESVVAVLKGFFPAENEANIATLAKENGWGFVVEDPSDDDAVPTLLRNPKWVDLIKPIFNVIGVLPGYKELDVSALFLIFLSVFFAFLIGDAGYGALFIAISLFFKVKLKGNAEAQNGLNLMVLMSACTVIWGVLTGTYFGIRPEFLPDALINMAPSYLKGAEASNHIMFICFTVGAVHLTIAHLWNFIRKINSLVCLGDLGWICCTWALYFVVLNMVVGMAYPFAQAILFGVLGAGVGLIVLSLLVSKAYFGFVTLVLDVINNFVDIISYVRLFAVGAASLAVATAFNDMAMGVGFSGVAVLGSAMILFLGHALNITLGAMGILVHGIRLNTLEFSGHAGVEWGGEKFQTFNKKSL
jgi:V/A-type H+-transporting ATPase subunit I